ncbi:UNVERIFIED_CONTAM: hypothetical protein RMT77_016859 [Armadillidium vulgare]
MNSKSIFLRCFALCIPLWIVCESSTLQEDILKQEEMDKSVHDILDEPLEEEGRLFFNFDRGAAFNTSVAFTIPLFSFTLPGAAETAATGLDANSFGVLAFVALFLLGGLGVSIYTTSQGGNEDGVEVLRGFGETNYFNNRLLNRVYDSLFELPEVLNVESCTQLCICSAHAEPERYGILAWPIRILVPARAEEAGQRKLSDYEKAANFGAQNLDECYYEYPCLIQPLDFVMYLKDYFLSST